MPSDFFSIPIIWPRPPANLCLILQSPCQYLYQPDCQSSVMPLRLSLGYLYPETWNQSCTCTCLSVPFPAPVLPSCGFNSTSVWTFYPWAFASSLPSINRWTAPACLYCLLLGPSLVACIHHMDFEIWFGLTLKRLGNNSGVLPPNGNHAFVFLLSVVVFVSDKLKLLKVSTFRVVNQINGGSFRLYSDHSKRDPV